VRTSIVRGRIRLRLGTAKVNVTTGWGLSADRPRAAGSRGYTQMDDFLAQLESLYRCLNAFAVSLSAEGSLVAL